MQTYLHKGLFHRVTAILSKPYLIANDNIRYVYFAYKNTVFRGYEERLAPSWSKFLAKNYAYPENSVFGSKRVFLEFSTNK